MSLRIITTEDGSHSLLNEELNETYHSTRGAKGESLHVFIKEGLEHWFSDKQADSIRILEVGFGTGLNAFLTALWASEHNKQVHYTAIEPFPVKPAFTNQLNYHQDENERALLLQIHEKKWEKSGPVATSFNLLKTVSRIEEFESAVKFDIIYFDAFAPKKQPEIWSLAVLKKCYDLLSSPGLLTTYCAQGQFKRDIKEAGFEVQTLGGAMGKKEMVRGIKAPVASI